MKKLMLSVAAVTALASAALPAAAQTWRGDDRYDRYDNDDRYDDDNRFARPGYSDWLNRNIERARQTGQISGREAWRLRSQVDAIDNLERRYRADGRLSARETVDLNQRKDRVAAQINVTRGRDYGYRDDRRW
jgi:hypothetical protein